MVGTFSRIIVNLVTWKMLLVQLHLVNGWWYIPTWNTKIIYMEGCLKNNNFDNKDTTPTNFNFLSKSSYIFTWEFYRNLLAGIFIWKSERKFSFHEFYQKVLYEFLKFLTKIFSDNLYAGPKFPSNLPENFIFRR